MAGRNVKVGKFSITAQSYYALAGVFFVAALFTLDRIAIRSAISMGAAHPPMLLDKPTANEAALMDPLHAEPWSFFHPAWTSNESVWPHIPFVRESNSVPTELPVDVSTLVSDPGNRVEKEFKVPAGLRDRVLFWMQVHAVYNSRMRVVHDRANPGIIYGYIDFRPLFHVLGAGVATEVRCNGIEKKILAELKIRLAEAAEITKTARLTWSEKNELRSFLSRIGALGRTNTAALICAIRTQTGQSDEFLAALHRSKNLLPHIESVFRTQRLPIALGRIPFVESSFNVRAKSKVGAVGIWQFMPETARQMIRGGDEKRWADPLRQTSSAAKMLKIYHGLLPDWGTAITAYNSGVGHLQTMVKKYKVHGIEELIDLPGEDGLGFAGKNFYAQFLSANLIEAYKDDLFNHQVEPADYMLVFKGAKPFPRESCDM